MVHLAILLSAALIALTSAVPFTLDTRNGGAAPKALYTMNNDPAGNVVYAMKINVDGSLSDGATYPTGGKGGSLLQPGSTDQFTERDGLSSSTSVVVNANVGTPVRNAATSQHPELNPSHRTSTSSTPAPTPSPNSASTPPTPPASLPSASPSTRKANSPSPSPSPGASANSASPIPAPPPP